MSRESFSRDSDNRGDSQAGRDDATGILAAVDDTDYDPSPDLASVSAPAGAPSTTEGVRMASSLSDADRKRAATDAVAVPVVPAGRADWRTTYSMLVSRPVTKPVASSRTRRPITSALTGLTGLLAIADVVINLYIQGALTTSALSPEVALGLSIAFSVMAFLSAVATAVACVVEGRQNRGNASTMSSLKGYRRPALTLKTTPN